MNRKDVVLIVSICLLASICYLILGKESVGDIVVVTQDGKPYATYDLDTNQVIEIDSEHGENTLVIEDGHVFMQEADCPDQYCMKQGKLPGNNTAIICLPHKLVVEVKGKKKNVRVDAVSG